MCLDPAGRQQLTPRIPDPVLASGKVLELAYCCDLLIRSVPNHFVEIAHRQVLAIAEKPLPDPGPTGTPDEQSSPAGP